MSNELISVIDLASKHGWLKQTVFKVLKRLSIEPVKRPGANNRGQIVAYITLEDAERVVGEFKARESSRGQNSPSIEEVCPNEQGVFYLLSLEPHSDPERFKVGFAASLPERLRQLRCSAPFARVVSTWPCKRLWERTAIDCVTDGSERIHTEVFRSTSLSAVRQKCDQFFALMPKVAK